MPDNLRNQPPSIHKSTGLIGRLGASLLGGNHRTNRRNVSGTWAGTMAPSSFGREAMLCLGLTAAAVTAIDIHTAQGAMIALLVVVVARLHARAEVQRAAHAAELRSKEQEIATKNAEVRHLRELNEEIGRELEWLQQLQTMPAGFAEGSTARSEGLVGAEVAEGADAGDWEPVQMEASRANRACQRGARARPQMDPAEMDESQRRALAGRAFARRDNARSQMRHHGPVSGP